MKNDEKYFSWSIIQILEHLIKKKQKNITLQT